MKDIKYASLIVGSIIGAGFASGKELAIFFAQFGKFCYIAPAIIFLLFFIVIKKILEIYKNKKEINFFNKKSIKIVFLIIYLIFSASMLSALRDFFILINNNFNNIFLDLILFILLFLILFFGFKGILNINKIVVPFLIVIFVFSTVYACVKPITTDLFVSVEYNKVYKIIFNSITYVFSNVVLCLLIMQKISQQNDSNPKRIAIISSLVVAILLLMGLICLNINGAKIIDTSMPFVVLGSYFEKIYSIFISIVILLAIVTSLFSSAFCVEELVKNKIKTKVLRCILCCFTIYLISKCGFDFIVEYFYTIIGVVGVFLIYLLFFKPAFNPGYDKIHKSSKNTKD